jgi:hypothetical protein
MSCTLLLSTFPRDSNGDAFFSDLGKHTYRYRLQRRSSQCLLAPQHLHRPHREQHRCLHNPQYHFVVNIDRIAIVSVIFAACFGLTNSIGNHSLYKPGERCHSRITVSSHLSSFLPALLPQEVLGGRLTFPYRLSKSVPVHHGARQ